jgi:hypothetical protein
MYLSPEAQRLLADVRGSHERLIAHTHADAAHRRAFRAVYEALESALGDVEDDHLNRSIDGGWSPAEVLVHLAQHDQQFEEADRRGVEHMIEHGLEHARSLWIARLPSSDGAGGAPGC